jgi:hypothetical protein
LPPALDVPRAAEQTSFDMPPVTSHDVPPVTSFDLPPVTEAAFNMPPAYGESTRPGESTRVFDREDFAGYARAQRQRRIRRRWFMSLLAVGTAAILAVMAMELLKFGKQPDKQTVALNNTPAARHTTAAPSPSPSVTASGARLTDNSSGLSYSQLSSPWQAQCPSGQSNNSFTWTAGESASAGQVTINGSQGTWYGTACSGPLGSGGYNGVQDLSNTTQNLENTFENSYYNGLQHTTSQVISTPLQVSGHAAWEDKFLITYTDASGQGLAWTSETGAVVVVDRGTGVAPAVFYVSMPSNLGMGNVDTLVNSLQLPGASATSSSASATSSASVAGSPTASPTGSAGGGGNDNGGGGNGGGGGGHHP